MYADSGGVGMIVGGTNATVSPCRVVCLDTGSTGVSRQVIQQTTANGFSYGIAGDGEKNAPGVTGSDITILGQTGDLILTYPPGRVCLAEFGASATIGQELASDANGRLVPYTDTGAGNVWIVAWCIETVTQSGTVYPWMSVFVVGYWKYLSS